jgi:pyruvate dehydrogenase E2 component (dihydrolipoamide acetyltransferase)
MSKIRRITADTMAKAWTTVPHVTVDDKADVTDLEAMRQRYKKRAEAAGGRLTITAIFVKLCAAALKAHPTLNASIDTEAGEIEYHNDCDIGVAVDTPRGLLVPVIDDADQKSVFDIAKELTELSGKAREGKVTPDEMAGATFSITNLGSIGTGHFTPIVNPPQVAILGMGRARQEPVWIDGQFQPREMAPLSLSFDHRLVDGADGARFLRWIVEAVEEPMIMVLES